MNPEIALRRIVGGVDGGKRKMHYEGQVEIISEDTDQLGRSERGGEYTLDAIFDFNRGEDTRERSSREGGAHTK